MNVIYHLENWQKKRVDTIGEDRPKYGGVGIHLEVIHKLRNANLAHIKPLPPLYAKITILLTVSFKL